MQGQLPIHRDMVLEIIHTANSQLPQLDRLRGNVLSSLLKAIPADSASFFLFNERMKPRNPVAINLAEKYLDSYQNHYHRFNPFDPLHLQIPSGSVVIDSHLFRLSEFKKTLIFNEFLKPQQVRRQMMIYLKSQNKLLGFIGLHRSEEKAVFTHREQTVAETVAPFLAQSLENAQLFSQAQNRQNLFQAILNQTSIGVAVLDNQLQLVFENQKARHICSLMQRQKFPCRIFENSQGVLPMAVVECCLQLNSQLDHRPNHAAHSAGSCSMTLSAGKPYTVRAELLVDTTPAVLSPVFMVTFDEDLSETRDIDESKLGQVSGLSRREIEIIHYLFKGFRNSEIAHYLDISAGTVKNHLKNIFHKMGVTSRTSLIYEVLTLSGQSA